MIAAPQSPMNTVTKRTLGMSTVAKIDLTFWLAFFSFSGIIGGGVWATATRSSDLDGVQKRQEQIEKRQDQFDDRWRKDHDLLTSLASSVDRTMEMVKYIYQKQN